MILAPCEFTQVSAPKRRKGRRRPGWNRLPIVTAHAHNATEIPMIRAQVERSEQGPKRVKFELVEPSDEDTPTVPLPPENDDSPDRTIPLLALLGRPVRIRMDHAIQDVRSSMDLLRAHVSELSVTEAVPTGTNVVGDMPEAVFHADRFTVPTGRKDRR